MKRNQIKASDKGEIQTDLLLKNNIPDVSEDISADEEDPVRTAKKVVKNDKDISYDWKY